MRSNLFLLFILISSQFLGTLQHQRHDDEDSVDDKVCLLDAVGLGYAITSSSYHNQFHQYPVLNQCIPGNACSWCFWFANIGQWITVTATN